MISFCFYPTQKINGKIPEEYPDVLNFEGAFKIKINGESFFSQPHFSVLEFLMFADKWVTDNDKTKNMLYDCIDTDDNPIISFVNKNGKWYIHSPWQLFKCHTPFSRGELENAILRLKESIRY